MPTLKVILEEIARLGSGYLLSDHGAYWLASDLLERLEQETPERLMYPVSWVVREDSGEGAVYASDEAEVVLSPEPLYQLHRLKHLEPALDVTKTPGTGHP